MAQTRPVVTKEEGVWVLRLERPDGRKQEYRCSTESQARQFALMLAPGEGSVGPPART